MQRDVSHNYLRVAREKLVIAWRPRCCRPLCWGNCNNALSQIETAPAWRALFLACAHHPHTPVQVGLLQHVNKRQSERLSASTYKWWGFRKFRRWWWWGRHL